MATPLSPLKAKPLRLPGQSLDEEIDYSINECSSQKPCLNSYVASPKRFIQLMWRWRHRICRDTFGHR
jgi:hypothetical protein